MGRNILGLGVFLTITTAARGTTPFWAMTGGFAGDLGGEEVLAGALGDDGGSAGDFGNEEGDVSCESGGEVGDLGDMDGDVDGDLGDC